jgi:hypothetical protein
MRTGEETGRTACVITRPITKSLGVVMGKSCVHRQPISNIFKRLERSGKIERCGSGPGFCFGKPIGRMYAIWHEEKRNSNGMIWCQR